MKKKIGTNLSTSKDVHATTIIENINDDIQKTSTPPLPQRKRDSQSASVENASESTSLDNHEIPQRAGIQKPPKKISSRKKKFLIFLSSFLIIVLFIGLFSLNALTRIKNNLETTITYSSEYQLTKPINILLIGTDEGEGYGSYAQTEKGDTSGSESAHRSDTLIALSINPITANISMVSIPRDTYVYIACNGDSGSYGKVNSAYTMGYDTDKKEASAIACTKKTVEDLLDVSFDQTVKVNFYSVKAMVDAVGGVDINSPYAFDEQSSNNSNQVQIKKGENHLNGEGALAYSRFRTPHEGVDPWDDPEWEIPQDFLNDFGRNARQQQVIGAIAKKIIETRDIGVVTKMLDIVQKDMKTSMSTDELVQLGGFFIGLMSKLSTLSALDADVSVLIKNPSAGRQTASSFVTDVLKADTSKVENVCYRDVQNKQYAFYKKRTKKQTYYITNPDDAYPTSKETKNESSKEKISYMKLLWKSYTGSENNLQKKAESGELTPAIFMDESLYKDNQYLGFDADTPVQKMPYADVDNGKEIKEKLPKLDYSNYHFNITFESMVLQTAAMEGSSNEQAYEYSLRYASQMIRKNTYDYGTSFDFGMNYYYDGKEVPETNCTQQSSESIDEESSSFY